jgi:hypothetical protein
MRSRDYDYKYGEPKSENVIGLRKYEERGESNPNYHMEQILKAPGRPEDKKMWVLNFNQKSKDRLLFIETAQNIVNYKHGYDPEVARVH